MPVPMWKLQNGESLSSFCKRTGIKYHTIYQEMIKKNITPDEALSNIIFRKKNNMYGNSKYLYKNTNLKNYCFLRKIPYSTVFYYLKKGCSFEESIKKGIKNDER